MGLPDLMIAHVGRGPETTFDKARYVSHDRWGCLNSRLFTSDVARRLLWIRPGRCLPWIRKISCVTAEVQYINKSSIPKQKMTVAIRPRSQSDYKYQI